MVPPTDPWYEDLTDVNPYDGELAKQQLAEAGYADGFTFTLDTPSYDPHPAVAEFLQSQLAEVGITVEINTISADEWFDGVRRSAPFATLPRSAYEATLDLLSGKYPSTDFAELRPRLLYDRDTGTLPARPGPHRRRR